MVVRTGMRSDDNWSVRKFFPVERRGKRTPGFATMKGITRNASDLKSSLCRPYVRLNATAKGPNTFTTSFVDTSFATAENNKALFWAYNPTEFPDFPQPGGATTSATGAEVAHADNGGADVGTCDATSTLASLSGSRASDVGAGGADTVDAADGDADAADADDAIDTGVAATERHRTARAPSAVAPAKRRRGLLSTAMPATHRRGRWPSLGKIARVKVATVDGKGAAVDVGASGADTQVDEEEDSTDVDDAGDRQGGGGGGSDGGSGAHVALTMRTVPPTMVLSAGASIIVDEPVAIELSAGDKRTIDAGADIKPDNTLAQSWPSAAPPPSSVGWESLLAQLASYCHSEHGSADIGGDGRAYLGLTTLTDDMTLMTGLFDDGGVLA